MDGRDRYLAERVTTATPGQLIKMLLDRLLVELDMAKSQLDVGQRPAASPHILRAQDIVTELRSSLNLDAGDIAGQLDELYSYAFAELVEAHLGGDPTHISHAATVLAPVQDAWTNVLASQSQPAAAV
jgi:flagellar secretion chaperone FliS